MSSVFDLKLHERSVAGDWHITRVPGGWIYSFTDYNAVAYDRDMGKQNEISTHSVFVPYTKEVKEERMEDLLCSAAPSA